MPTKKTKQPETVIAYKGFDKNLRCRDHQFEVGQSYELTGGTIQACSYGFHACENPLDVWSYYSPFDSRFAVVELSGELSRHDEDSKIAAAKITIKAELSLPEFIGKAVQAVIDATTKARPTKKTKLSDNAGDHAQIGSSGDSARIGSSGDHAQIGSSGNYAQIGSSGDNAQIGSSGNYAQIGSSGDHAQIGSSGNYAQIGSSGDNAQIGSSGDHARIGSSGDNAQIEASGTDSVVASAGLYAQVKAAEGTWVSVAEFNNLGKCVGFATGCIGQDGLLADTWYRAQAGKLVRL